MHYSAAENSNLSETANKAYHAASRIKSDSCFSTVNHRAYKFMSTPRALIA